MMGDMLNEGELHVFKCKDNANALDILVQPNPTKGVSRAFRRLASQRRLGRGKPKTITFPLSHTNTLRVLNQMLKQHSFITLDDSIW